MKKIVIIIIAMFLGMIIGARGVSASAYNFEDFPDFIGKCYEPFADICVDGTPVLRVLAIYDHSSKDASHRDKKRELEEWQKDHNSDHVIGFSVNDCNNASLIWATRYPGIVLPETKIIYNLFQGGAFFEKSPYLREWQDKILKELIKIFSVIHA